MVSAKKPTQSMFVDDDEQQPTTKPKAPVKKKSTHVKTEDTVGLHDSDKNILMLPSMGVLGYPEKVSYRDIMFKDEEILSLATPDTYAETLNSVLKGVLNDCEFFEDISVFDRDYLLVWLWANNYTSVKAMSAQCGHCGHSDDKHVDLSKAEVTDIKADDIPVPFKLPLKNATVTHVEIYLNTVQDELDVEKFMKKNPKANFEMILYPLRTKI
jgi:hypothetical protein